MSEFDKMQRWANGARAMPGVDVTERPWSAADNSTFGRSAPGIEATERPWMASDNAAFPNSNQAAAEAAHGARVNPAQPASAFTSPGYQDHFGPQAAADEGAAASEAGAANAGRFSTLRNFVGGGATGVGDAVSNVGSGLVSG